MNTAEKNKEFIDVEKTAEVLGKSVRTARWFIRTSYTDPSKIALDALRATSPEDSGNFKTVIKRKTGKRITGRYKWGVRRDFVEKYVELFQEKQDRIKKRKITEAQQKADRATVMRELAKKQQEREMNAKQEPIPQKMPVAQPAKAQLRNPLTEEQKIDLVLKTANEPTKEIMRALILELERKNTQYETAEQRAQAQLTTKDAHIQDLIASNNHLIQQLTTQQEIHQEQQVDIPEQPEQLQEQTAPPIDASLPQPSPATLAFYSQAQHAQYNPPAIQSPLEYRQQSKPQPESYRFGVALWGALTVLVVAAVLLVLAVGGIITF